MEETKGITMNLLVNDEVEVIITSLYGTTTVNGAIVSVGLSQSKEGVYWFQIAGMSTTFWSDEVAAVTKVG